MVIAVHYNLVDDDQIRKKGDFIGGINSLHAQDGKLSSGAHSRLFNIYYTHFYKAETWNVREPIFTSLCSCWNIAVWTLWDLLWDAHRCYLPCSDDKAW